MDRPMKKLICGDFFPRLILDMKARPGLWASRLVLLLGPWASFWMVEILNGNDVFHDLYAWQVLMNLIWYCLLFIVCWGGTNGPAPPGRSCPSPSDW